MNWCGEKQISFSIIFTKMDKLSSNELQKNMAKYRKEMLKYWEEMPPVFITSSSSQIGKEKVLKYIEHVNEQMTK
jgi:GTP-binding protein